MSRTFCVRKLRVLLAACDAQIDQSNFGLESGLDIFLILIFGLIFKCIQTSVKLMAKGALGKLYSSKL